MVAAYDIDTGGVRWAACEPGGGLFPMAAAVQDTVWMPRSRAPWENRGRVACHQLLPSADVIVVSSILALLVSGPFTWL
jgi:hypothetical protein